MCTQVRAAFQLLRDIFSVRCANTFNNADSLHGGCGPLTTFYVYSKIILFKESLNAKCLWMEGIDGECGSLWVSL